MMMIMVITIIVTPFASPVLPNKNDTDDKDEDCDDNYHRSILGIISAG